MSGQFILPSEKNPIPCGGGSSINVIFTNQPNLFLYLHQEEEQEFQEPF